MSSELKIIVFGLFFLIMLNFSLGFVIPDSVEDLNEEEILNEITDELGIISGFITTALINIGLFFFGLFGINFLSAIVLMPLWFNVILVTFNILMVLSIIFYLVDRLWIG